MPNGQWLSLPGALSGEVDQRIGLGNVTEASSPLDTSDRGAETGNSYVFEGWWVSAGAVEELGHSEDASNVVLDRQFVEAGRHGPVDGQ